MTRYVNFKSSPSCVLPHPSQCPSGTRVCLTQVNIKENELERVISVIPLAQSSKLNPELTVSPKCGSFLGQVGSG